jgi:hypothetical protein
MDEKENLLEFLLPEKWWIKTTEKSNNVIYDYYSKLSGSVSCRTLGNYYGISKKSNVLIRTMFNTNPVDHFVLESEITFEQFKKYVLKEEINPIKSKHTFTNSNGFVYEEDEVYLYDNQIIVRFIKECKSLNNFLRTSDRLYIKNYNLTFSINNVRKATTEEILWLETCEKADKYVDKPIMKETKFIVGKWYEVIWDVNPKQKTYIKPTEVDKYYVIYNRANSLWDGGIYINGHYEIKSLTIVKEVSLKEIQQYLPDDHEDKIKWIPQIGEWVVLFNYSNSYNGKTVKITNIKDNIHVYFTPHEDSNHNCNIKHVRKALPHEIPVEVSTNPLTSKECFEALSPLVKFQVGDYVQIIGNTASSCNAIKDCGIITNISGAYAQIKVEGKKNTSSNWSYISDIILLGKAYLEGSTTTLNNQLTINQKENVGIKNNNKETSVNYDLQGIDYSVSDRVRIRRSGIDYSRTEEYSGSSNSYNEKRLSISY